MRCNKVAGNSALLTQPLYEGVGEAWRLLAEGLYSFPEVESSTRDAFQVITAFQGERKL